MPLPPPKRPFRPAFSRLVTLQRALLGCAVAVLALGPATDATANQGVAESDLAEQRYDEALDAYDRGELIPAIELFAAAAEAAVDTSLRAAAYNNACFVANQSGQPNRALPLCALAVDGFRELGDSGELARALNNLGLARSNGGSLREAERAFEESRSLHDGAGNLVESMQVRSNLTNVYQAAGRFADAEAELMAMSTDLEPLLGAEGRAVHEQFAANRINLAVLYEQLGRYREAASLLRLVADGSDPGLAPRTQAFAEANLAVTLRNLGNSAAALDRLENARQIFEDLGDEAGLLNVLINRGRILSENRADPAGAEEALQQAVVLSRRLGDRLQEVDSLLRLAHLERTTGRLDAAALHVGEAAALAAQAQLTQALWQVDAEAGRIHAQRGDASSALERLRAAATAIDQLQSDTALRRLDNRTVVEQRGVFEALVSLLVRSAETGAPQGRDASLAEALHWTLRAKQRQLADRLGTSAGAAQTVQFDPATTLRAVRDAMDPQAVLLEFFAAEDRWLRFIVTATTLVAADLGPTAPLDQAARDVHRALASAQSPRSADLDRLAVLLPDLQTGPPEAGTSTSNTLFVAADRALRYLPFEILPSGENLALHAWTVRYLPSALTLLRPSISPGETNASPHYRLVGLGGIEVPGLAPLPATNRELREAARSLGTHRLLFGGDATLAALRDATRGGAYTLHLATHTTFDDRSGAASVLQLAKEPIGSEPITPRQISELDLDVGLTVLSACSTSSGLELDGQGVETLVGSFLAAGSRGVLASLWDVGDNNTAEFMRQFYYQLAAGHGAAVALRRTKLELLRDPRWQAPHLWSAFVLFGESPLPRRTLVGRLRGSASWHYLALAAAVLAATGAWLTRRGQSGK